jgi:hypothetical protein
LFSKAFSISYFVELANKDLEIGSPLMREKQTAKFTLSGLPSVIKEELIFGLA